MNYETVKAAVLRSARRWMDPEFPTRSNAVARTLEQKNRFTFESITFAINQQVNQLGAKSIESFVGERMDLNGLVVGVLGPGNVPFVGLQDFLCVILHGGAYRGALSSRSPFLLEAFAETVADEVGIDAMFFGGSNADKLNRLVAESDVIVATGSDDTLDVVRTKCEDRHLTSMLLRKSSISVAVLSGSETVDDFELLAEDCFLHDGLGCRSVAIIFAPEALSVDPFLESAGHFRTVFPAHEETKKDLNVRVALLEATASPCAFPDDRSFLVSRGTPDTFGAGHVRWVVYDNIEFVSQWIEANRSTLQLVVAGESVASQLAVDVPIVGPGTAQRPALDWAPDGISLTEFLRSALTERLNS